MQVTLLCNYLQLQHRRKVVRLTLLHKALHSKAAVNIPLYIEHKPTLKTRRSDPLKFLPLHTSCDAYKYSFWPRTIRDWNNLQPEILIINDTNTFRNTIKYSVPGRPPELRPLGILRGTICRCSYFRYHVLSLVCRSDAIRALISA